LFKIKRGDNTIGYFLKAEDLVQTEAQNVHSTPLLEQHFQAHCSSSGGKVEDLTRLCVLEVSYDRKISTVTFNLGNLA
jgi:hypothetical protein